MGITRVLRRVPVSPQVARITRCNASNHPGVPFVAAVYLATIAVPNNAGRQWPLHFAQLIEGAWWACEACWTRMTAWPELTVDDGDQGDQGADVDGDDLLYRATDAIGQLGHVVTSMEVLRRRAESDADTMRVQVRATYRERAHLVALLAAQMPSWWLHDSREPDFPVVVIRSPEGQLAWHVHVDDLDLFGHVNAANVEQWDGHSTEEKYQRVRALTAGVLQLYEPAEYQVIRARIMEAAEQLPRSGNIMADVARLVNAEPDMVRPYALTAAGDTALHNSNLNDADDPSRGGGE